MSGTVQHTLIICTERGTVHHTLILCTYSEGNGTTHFNSMYREGNGTTHFKDGAVYIGQYKQGFTYIYMHIFINIYNNYENFKKKLYF